ncbi:MAG: FecR family protein [Marinifilaceae bacterium]
MNLEENTEKLIDKLYLHIIGELTEVEENELQEWISATPENKSLYTRVVNNDSIYHKYISKSKQKMADDWDVIVPNLEIKPRRAITKILFKYVAAICFISVAIWGIYTNLDNGKNLNIPSSNDECITAFTTNTPYLELAQGARISLGIKDTTYETNIHGNIVKEAQDGLHIILDDTQTTVDEDFNRLVVPRGGEYKLTLSDGTVVWLNSESVLEFPLVFTKDTRRVRLTGEAIFDVHRNENVPFVVEMENMNVKVMGTSFNISTHDNIVRTTLISGRVEIETYDEKLILIPGQQAKLETGTLSVDNVDVDEHIAWRDGRFIFRSKPLKEVLSILSRWYDLDFILIDESIEKLHFTGNIPRHASIEDVLKLIECTNLIKFSIAENEICVSKQ